MFSWVNRRTLTTGKHTTPNKNRLHKKNSQPIRRTPIISGNRNEAQKKIHEQMFCTIRPKSSWSAYQTLNISTQGLLLDPKHMCIKYRNSQLRRHSNILRMWLLKTNPHVAYHILCNDIEKYETAVLTKNMEELVANTKSKFSNSKIMISLGLPRRDPEFNLIVNTTNITLQNLFCSDPSVEICDNSNLFYRGYPQRGISSFKKRNSGTSQQFEGWTIPHDMTIRKYLKIGNWNIHSLKSRLYDKSTDKTFLWQISH